MPLDFSSAVPIGQQQQQPAKQQPQQGPASAGGLDFSTAVPLNTKPQQENIPAETSPSWGGAWEAVKQYATHALPVDQVIHAVTHPIEALKSFAQSSAPLPGEENQDINFPGLSIGNGILSGLRQQQAHLQQHPNDLPGAIARGTGETIRRNIPLFGPPMGQALVQGTQGVEDVAGGKTGSGAANLASAAGTLTNLFAPEAAGAIVSVPGKLFVKGAGKFVPPIARPLSQAANDVASNLGLHLNIGDVTGNRLVQQTGKSIEHTIGGNAAMVNPHVENAAKLRGQVDQWTGGMKPQDYSDLEKQTLTNTHLQHSQNAHDAYSKVDDLAGDAVQMPITTGTPFMIKPSQILGEDLSLPSVVQKRGWTGTDANDLADYTDKIRNGNTPPPITLEVNPQGKLSIRDGWHRVMASKAAGDVPIPAQVNPIIGQAPGQITATVSDTPFPVNVSTIKEALRPQYEKALQAKEYLQRGNQSDLALHQFMTGPDVVPATVADQFLGTIKQMARDGNDAVAGKAAPLISQLHDQIGQQLAAVSPEAAQALQEGRAATVAKYNTEKVMNNIGIKWDDQMKQWENKGSDFSKLIAKGPEAAQKVKNLLDVAPQLGQPLAQAIHSHVYDPLMTEPGSFGKIAGKPNGNSMLSAAGTWSRINQGTKDLLFTPEHQAEVNGFNEVANRLEENPNSSNSGAAVNIGNAIKRVQQAGAVLGVEHLMAHPEAVLGGAIAGVGIPYAAAKLFNKPEIFTGARNAGITSANLFKNAAPITANARRIAPLFSKQDQNQEQQ